MKIEENLRFAMASYKFMFRPVEDYLNGQQGMHLDYVQILDDKKNDYQRIPAKLKAYIDNNGVLIQERLNEFADAYCRKMNAMWDDVKYERIELKYPDRLNAAVMRYELIYGRFEPTHMFVWYLTDVMDLDGFLKSEVEKRFPYKGTGTGG